MKSLLTQLAKLWTAWFLLLFALSFLVQFPLYAVLLRIETAHPLVHRMRVGWAWFLFCLTGVRPSIRRDVPLDRKQSYIYCANHFSYLDIPILAASVTGTSYFMAKQELTKIPLFGLFFRTIDIAVPRGNNRGSHRAFELASQRLKAGGNIMIFPEGGILPNAPTLKAFKSGAFRLAVANNIPIVPVSLVDNWKILPDRPWPAFFPGKSRVVVHAPLYPEAFGFDEHALRKKTYDIIHQTLTAQHEN